MEGANKRIPPRTEHYDSTRCQKSSRGIFGVTGGSSWHTVLPVIHPQLPYLLSVFPDPPPLLAEANSNHGGWGLGAGGVGLALADCHWDSYGLALDFANRPWSWFIIAY